MHGALPFKGWGRFVQGGYEYAMYVFALLAHPLGLTLQPTSTICRGRRTEAHASAWPQSLDLFGAPGLGRRPASWPHRYPRSLQTGHRRRRFGATFGANLKEWNHWHKCAPAMHARTCPTQVFSKYFILGGWNIPRGWKNKFAKVGLIEWASLQWILKSRTLILSQDQEKLIFKKSFESARKTHIRDFF